MQWSVESSRRKTDISAPPSENPHQSSSALGALGALGALRFGQGTAAQQYPLPVEQELSWQRGGSAGTFEARIDLQDLQADELLVPSLVLPSLQHSEQRYSYTCSLTAGGSQWSLATVCSHPTKTAGDSGTKTSGATTDVAQSDNVSTHIDLFAIKTPLKKPQLHICLHADSRPTNYLLVVSRRQHRMTSADAYSQAVHRPHHEVPALSQMTQPSAQRNGTCSPTALSMIMAHYGAPFHPATVDACKDPATGMYGVWPLNIVQAGLRGFTGAVELVSTWADLAAYEGPFVASISFAEGKLEGAPLKSTAGHLVVVCGASDKGVLCNDPAAPSAATVRREYDLKQFTDAWLGSRGAAYLLSPACPTASAKRVPSI